jgi:hypothetical protein
MRRAGRRSPYRSFITSVMLPALLVWVGMVGVIMALIAAV